MKGKAQKKLEENKWKRVKWRVAQRIKEIELKGEIGKKRGGKEEKKIKWVDKKGKRRRSVWSDRDLMRTQRAIRVQGDFPRIPIRPHTRKGKKRKLLYL